MPDLNLHDHIPLTEYGPHGPARYEYSWRGEYLDVCLISDVGHKRENNEDSCLICAPEDRALARQRGILVAVADGMGGASAGELASRLTLRQTANALYLDTNGLSSPDALRAAVEKANLQVFEASEQDPRLSGMGTTISALLLVGAWAYIAQVGDSRVYVARKGTSLRQVTEDHSLVAEQMRCGLITAEEARTHAMKNLITRAVGIKENVKVDMFAIRLQQGDTVLICSDGLSNMVGDVQLERILVQSDLGSAGQMLTASALDAGGTDNITSALMRITGEPPPSEFEEGAQPVVLDRPPGGFVNRLRRLLG
jgi:protein phosphatase